MREDKIYELKALIRDYEDILETLHYMTQQWNKYDDPASDPGLQFEKENELDHAYNKIVDFAKNKML